MRIRLDATTRSPASSSILVTAPVRLRRVASGLMMEKVRVAAMTGRSPVWDVVEIGPPTSGAAPPEQGSSLALPLAAFVSPIAALYPFPAGKQLPRQAGALERIAAEQIESAVVGQRCFAPDAVGNQHCARL